MRPRWRKVLSDLWDNKMRTLLVVLSIAVGVLAVGVITGAYVIISQDMSASYSANHPANVEIRMDDFDTDYLNIIRRYPNIDQMEARRVFAVRARPAGQSKWTMLDILAFQDFKKNKVNLLVSVEGEISPQKDQLLVERDALKKLNAQVGDVIEFQLQDGSIRQLTLAGVVQDAATNAGDFLSPPVAYIAMDTLTTFQQPKSFNRIYATVQSGQDDESQIRNTLAEVKNKIEKSDHTVYRTFTSLTHRHPLASTVNAVLGILMALGVLVVFLSSSLIANTLNALLNQHLRHIGVMKLLGGRDRQIFGMYLVLILSFGVLALLIAVPLGGRGAYALSSFIAIKIGFSLLDYRIVPLALLVQVAIGVIVPLAAGFVPVINGSRVTVLRAISGDLAREAGDQQQEERQHETRFERIQLRFTQALARRGIHIPRPLLISLRNTFRRRGRLMLTLFTLIMGGAIFIAVFNVRVTLHEFIADLGNYFLADVTVNFEQPYRLNKVKQNAMQIPGVTSVEGWLFSNAEIIFPDGSVADNLDILSPPGNSPLVSPLMVSGRWITPTDQKKLAISEGIYALYPNLQVGDYLPLKINGKRESWQVVGIFKFADMQGIIGYAPYEYISRMQHLANRSYSFRIVTSQHSRAAQEAAAQNIDTYFRDHGFHVSEAQPGLAMLDTASESLDTLVTFLLIMALLTATVGSMGLAGTMSMNVLERTREIGIMRAVGANDREVVRMVIVEGLLIGLISWVLGALLSIPFTYLLSTIVSLAIFRTPITVVFTPSGFLIWLGLVVLLSSLASILPARNAAHLTIREVLAYE